ncbi:hypothetical protein [Halodesulfovibrio sp. MK-HDV]|jgi:hypothetical protein|uniref:hypothetical protein n=1 Tax=Halodesulfovibrio sp. MK-HDV TaxID=2599925 RepID=UPI00136F67BA|nr:hypothetical protein [Halodesulfovibrio sp. MK-HDV]KAF1076052.1 hypothetical protein MKHDV_01488 [Halodesulfovibrio sp. MK-HDV]
MPKSHQAMTTEEFVSKEVFKSHDSSGADTRTRKDDSQTEYWKVLPKAGSCDLCQAMGEGIHWEKPERPHPNCKCEIEKRSTKVDIEPAIENARRFGKEFSDVTLQFWKLLGIIPDPRQKAAEGLADIINEINKGANDNSSSNKKK